MILIVTGLSNSQPAVEYFKHEQIFFVFLPSSLFDHIGRKLQNLHCKNKREKTCQDEQKP